MCGVPAHRAGYRALADWLAGHGEISAVGVEGTGSYGAGLTRWLSAHQITVVEVNRPNRAERRRRGKSRVARRAPGLGAGRSERYVGADLP